MASKVDVAFLTGGDTWQSLSPKLIAARRLVLALFAVAFLIGAVVAYLVGPAWLAGVIAAVGLLDGAAQGRGAGLEQAEEETVRGGQAPDAAQAANFERDGPGLGAGGGHERGSVWSRPSA